MWIKEEYDSVLWFSQRSAEGLVSNSPPHSSMPVQLPAEVHCANPYSLSPVSRHSQQRPNQHENARNASRHINPLPLFWILIEVHDGVPDMAVAALREPAGGGGRDEGI